MKALTSFLLAGFCFGVLSCGEKEEPEQNLTAAMGEAAPDFSFVDIATGKAGKLSDHKGKVVVAKFWWSKCGLCNDGLDHLQTFIGEHPDWDDDVVYLAVGIDPKKKAAEDHLAKVEADEARSWSRIRTSWLDAEGGKSPVYRAYVESMGVPVSYLIDREGKIAAINGPTSPEELDLDKAVRAVLER